MAQNVIAQKSESPRKWQPGGRRGEGVDTASLEKYPS